MYNLCCCSIVHPIVATCCRYFRTDWLTVKKGITPWSKYCEVWGVEFQTLQRVYERTAKSSGLVRVAICGDGLNLEADKYTVELTPVGVQPADARPTTEHQAASAAHGFLHGLDAIQKVRSRAWCIACIAMLCIAWCLLLRLAIISMAASYSMVFTFP